MQLAHLAPAICSVWLFETLGQDLADADIRKLVSICTMGDYAPGDVITIEHSVAICPYILITGRLTLQDPGVLKTYPAAKMEEVLADEKLHQVIGIDIETLLLDDTTASELSVWAADYPSSQFY